jgi:hypothetical protein
MKRLLLILTKSNLNLKKKGWRGWGLLLLPPLLPTFVRTRPPSFAHSHSSTPTHPLPLTTPVLRSRSPALVRPLSFPCSHKPAPSFAFVHPRPPFVPVPRLARSCLFTPAHPCLFPFVPVCVASVRTRLCSLAPLIRACSRLRLAFVCACSRLLGCLPV